MLLMYFMFLFTRFGDDLDSNTQFQLGVYFMTIVISIMLINCVIIILALKRPAKLKYMKA